MNKYIIRIFILLTIFIPACTSSVSVISEEERLPEPVDKTQSKSLTICLGYEPQSLYPYLANSQAARDVLQAIYDGPIDMRNGQAIPVILEEIPSQATGSASYTVVDVKAGDAVINTAGYPVSLRAGVRVFPAGCFSSECAITWDGNTPLQLNQLSTVFRLKDGVNWSDGQPLSAADVLFGFQVAADSATPVARLALNQTSDYRVLDERSVEWIGKPGLVTDAFEDYFWMPLPEHAWGAYTAGQLLENEEVNRRPLGWGAYEVLEWVSGEFIRLGRNPFYFRSSEGLPYYDELIFKITNPTGDSNISNLKFNREPFVVYGLDIGELEKEVWKNGCDLISSSVDMRDQLQVFNILTNYFEDPSIILYPSQSGNLEILFLKQKYFKNNLTNDLQLRQAFTHCLDRERLINEISYGFFNNTEKLFGNPFLNSDPQDTIQSPRFDPEEGRRILEQLGWEEKNKQEGVLEASGHIDSLENNKHLSFVYLVENEALSLNAAQILKSSLSECGLDINILAVPSEIFWDKSNPNSIFQGNYNMVQLTWSEKIMDPCLFFQSDQIPSIENSFEGFNFSHFDSPVFNDLCDQYQNTHIPSERSEILKEMENRVREQIIAVPLYVHPKWIVSRNDFCTDPEDFLFMNGLEKIEEFRYDPACLLTE